MSDAPRTPWQQGIHDLLENAAAYKLRAESEAESRAARLAYEDETRPAPPHPDAAWQRRARFAFIRLVPFGFERMQWHHDEQWIWAAQGGDGLAWLEREIVAMEKLAAHHERQVRLTCARLLEEGFGLSDGTKPPKQSTYKLSPYSQDPDEDMTFLESLRSREEREARLRMIDEDGFGPSRRRLKLIKGGRRGKK